MDFYAVLDEVLELLQRHKRVTYRALKRQFGLDDAYLEDLKAEIIEARQLAVDQDGTMLVWAEDATALPVPPAAPARTQEHTPLAYTPKHLAEKILTSRSALEGERGHSLQMRIGVNTGLVVVGKIGDDLRINIRGPGDTTRRPARRQHMGEARGVEVRGPHPDHGAECFERRHPRHMPVQGGGAV